MIGQDKQNDIFLSNKTINSFFDLRFFLQEIMIEIRVTHIWVDTRLITSNLDGRVELEPAAISDLWTPDSYFHHTKESRFIRHMTPAASLTIYSNQTIRYSNM